MDMNQLRVNALRRLMGDLSQSEFAEKHDLNASYISQILSGHRSFGERAASNMEKKIGLPAGTLSRPRFVGFTATHRLSRTGDASEPRFMYGDEAHRSYSSSLALEDDLPDELLRIRRIIQRINAIVEFKCERNIEKLTSFTGLPPDELRVAFTREGDPEEFDELAQKLEIALELPEGAMSGEDGSPVSRHFYRYIAPDIYGSDEIIRRVAEATSAIRTISRATQYGAIEWEHVHKLQDIVRSLPELPSDAVLGLMGRRTKLDRDKTDEDIGKNPLLWF